jgi:hypothetical protein
MPPRNIYVSKQEFTDGDWVTHIAEIVDTVVNVDSFDTLVAAVKGVQQLLEQETGIRN